MKVVSALDDVVLGLVGSATRAPGTATLFNTSVTEAGIRAAHAPASRGGVPAGCGARAITAAPEPKRTGKRHETQAENEIEDV